MWTTTRTNEPGVLKLQINVAGQLLSFQKFVELLRHDNAFRTYFNAELAAAPFDAFRWETPAVNAANLGTREFECVLVDDPDLDRRPDVKSFAAYFKPHAREDVATFENLSRDAVLVVPCPLGAQSAYVHLATFVRNAPETQRAALWQQVAEAMLAEVRRRTVWLSTAGAGVAWLHVRLDSRPKYYSYRPYRTPPG